MASKGSRLTLTQFALKDISRNEFRSWMVFASSLLVAGLVLAASLLLQGTSESLQRTRNRLGADMLVVPERSEGRVENALLMGAATSAWMPDDNVGRIRALPGVAAASPQLYLASLAGASCCSVSSMFIVAFEPETDFTVQPWLEHEIGGTLDVGEAVGGAFVSLPDGEENIRIYGYPLTLASTLDPTGGNLDQSMFLTFETAKEVARRSVTDAEQPLEIPDDSVSAVLVRVDEGIDPNTVAGAILSNVPGVGVVMSPEMFGTFRDQISTMRGGLLLALGLTVVLSLMLIAVVFAMATHERRREIGVWRALGATRAHVVRALVMQAAILAAAGGLAGVALAAYGIFLFHDYIVGRIGVPFLFPAFSALAPLLLLGLFVAVMTAILASLAPALRVSSQDPASAMRE
ncbi:MAG: ABC transporter permease [Coriobacteriia bacterium]